MASKRPPRRTAFALTLSHGRSFPTTIRPKFRKLIDLAAERANDRACYSDFARRDCAAPSPRYTGRCPAEFRPALTQSGRRFAKPGARDQSRRSACQRRAIAGHDSQRRQVWATQVSRCSSAMCRVFDSAGGCKRQNDDSHELLARRKSTCAGARPQRSPATFPTPISTATTFPIWPSDAFRRIRWPSWRPFFRKSLRTSSKRSMATWERRLNIASGKGGFGAVTDAIIEAAARQVITQNVPAEYETQHICPSCGCQRAVLASFAVRARQQLSEGSLAWVYLGHGWPTELDRVPTATGSESILSVGDVPKLRCGGHSPLAVLVACYTGAMDAPRELPGRGAVDGRRRSRGRDRRDTSHDAVRKYRAGLRAAAGVLPRSARAFGRYVADRRAQKTLATATDDQLASLARLDGRGAQPAASGSGERAARARADVSPAWRSAAALAICRVGSAPTPASAAASQ